MKAVHWVAVILVSFAFLGTAAAVMPGQKVEYPDGAVGKVVFDGKVHADKGLKCNDCHTKIFQMKKGTSKITMTAMNKGENCGACHNGTKAFKSSDPANCAKCHKK